MSITNYSWAAAWPSEAGFITKDVKDSVDEMENDKKDIGEKDNFQDQKKPERDTPEKRALHRRIESKLSIWYDDYVM